MTVLGSGWRGFMDLPTISSACCFNLNMRIFLLDRFQKKKMREQCVVKKMKNRPLSGKDDGDDDGS